MRRKSLSILAIILGYILLIIFISIHLLFRAKDRDFANPHLWVFAFLVLGALLITIGGISLYGKSIIKHWRKLVWFIAELISIVIISALAYQVVIMNYAFDWYRIFILYIAFLIFLLAEVLRREKKNEN